MYDLRDVPVVIGTGVGADIRLADEFASECHCIIREQDGETILQDHYSDWGTFVNGERVVEARITPGDRIAIGLSLFEATGNVFDSGPADEFHLPESNLRWQKKLR